MRKGTLYRLLTIFSCLCLVLNTTPLTPAYAGEGTETIEESEEHQASTEGANEAAPSTTEDAPVVSGEQETEKETNESDEVEDTSTDGGFDLLGIIESLLGTPTYESGTLTETVTCDDDTTVKVSLSFDEKAQIPADARLVLRTSVATDAQGVEADIRQAVGITDADFVLKTHVLRVSVVANDTEVVPQSSVRLAVSVSNASQEYPVAPSLAWLEAEGGSWQAVGNDADDAADYSLETNRLGFLGVTFALARIASFEEKGSLIDVYAEGGVGAWTVSDRDSVEVEEGQELLRVFGASVSTSSKTDPTCWLRVQSPDAEDNAADVDAGRLRLYRVQGGVLQDELIGDEQDDLVALDAKNDAVALVWDTGLRSRIVEAGQVTVEGLLPKGCQGVAQDITDSFGNEETLVALESQTGVLTAQSDELTSLTCAAAYEVGLLSNDAKDLSTTDKDLRVTIEDEAIDPNADQSVLAQSEDGGWRRVEDAEFSSGSVSFTTQGLGDFVVLERSLLSTQADSEVSTGFTLYARAKGQLRYTQVTFVDENKNPLPATVGGIITRTYTGSGTVGNDENTIDLYSYDQALDPSIADEYEFSRVYIHFKMGTGDQKDFRYMQVGDDSDIKAGGKTDVFRAYFNMNGIHENMAGRTYNGTWYQLSMGGAMDPVFIEFFHVSEPQFRAIDERGDPVEGAEFTLYEDEMCYTVAEHHHTPIVATSGEDGLVSFGKIPRGTYYLKETQTPEGFKKTTKVYTFVVDGETALPDIVHEDDDGSVILADIERMTIHKAWKDGGDHTGDSVTVEVTSNDELIERVVLDEDNDWTAEVDELDPNVPYLLSETEVRNGTGEDVTHDWIAHITAEDDEVHPEYLKATSFQRGKDYVLVAGGKGLNATTVLGFETVTTDGREVTSPVTDRLLWNVDSVTGDNVISLQNVGTGMFLDYNGSRWTIANAAPMFVRHTNNNGIINIYHRANINNTTTYWLYLVNRIDRTQLERDAADFELYRKINVKSVNVTIENSSTRYPVRMRNVEHPTSRPVSGMRYELMELASADDTEGTPVEGYTDLVAGDDGYLTASGSATFNLWAGNYALRQTQGTELYEPYVEPLRFTITRGGALRVRKADQVVPNFEYASTYTDSSTECPLIQIPQLRPGTVEISFEVEGAYADRSLEFGFTLDVPDSIQSMKATIDGEERIFTAVDGDFTLRAGQTLVLEDAFAGESYTITQTSPCVAATVPGFRGQYVVSAIADPLAGSTASVTVAQQADARVIVLTDLHGTMDDPARVKITNALVTDEIIETGIADEAGPWALVVACAFLGYAVLWTTKRKRRRA